VVLQLLLCRERAAANSDWKVAPPVSTDLLKCNPGLDTTIDTRHSITGKLDKSEHVVFSKQKIYIGHRPGFAMCIPVMASLV